MSDTEEKKSTGFDENQDITAYTIFEIIKGTVVKLKDKTAIILWSSFILLTLWGMKGDSQVFYQLFGDDLAERLFGDLVWREQLFSFITGFILLVIIPCLIIKFWFKEKLSDYGLGLPKGKTNIKLSVIAFFVTLVIALPLFYFGSFDAAMQAEYPLFGKNTITTWSGFIVYELVSFIFFIIIEFIFRGYLLFGLYGIKDSRALERVKGWAGPLVFGLYAVLIQMLAYTMWHVTKPVPEYVGALVWGVAVAAVALRIKSIWPIIFVHWVLNVFIDTVIWLR